MKKTIVRSGNKKSESAYRKVKPIISGMEKKRNAHWNLKHGGTK